MPFYEYQCKKCGHTLEAMQKINDSPLKKCPQCGKSQLMRLMSAPVFRLKGGGWYETDFKGDSDNKKNLADRPEAESAAVDSKPVTEAKATDATAKESAKPEKAVEKSADKPKTADKPAEKAAKPAAAESSKKAAPPAMSKRGASVPIKSKAKAPAKAPAKKPAAKAKGRR